jgi:hypothetical protein
MVDAVHLRRQMTASPRPASPRLHMSASGARTNFSGGSMRPDTCPRPFSTPPRDALQRSVAASTLMQVRCVPG